MMRGPVRATAALPRLRAAHARSAKLLLWKIVQAGLMLVLVLQAAPPSISADGTGAPEPADLVLQNAAVYTVDAARTWADAVAVREGKIVYVGTTGGAPSLIGSKTRVLDLEGKMVLPSFHDSHVHLVTGGLEMLYLRLYDFEKPGEVLEAIRKYAGEHPDDKWVRGFGWDLPVFEKANPHKELLDKIIPDRPAFFEAADHHSAWVNSRALEVSGITAKTPDPPRGRIERDPKTGEPTGTLREDAIDLVRKHMAAPTTEDYMEGLRRAQRLANSCGITSVQDAAVDETVLKAYKGLDQKGELTLRVRAALLVDPDRGEEQLADLVKLRQSCKSSAINAGSVKMFADGVVEVKTAALLEPYIGSGDNRGILNFAPERFNLLVRLLDAEGFQIHIHAIGDRAVRAALDAHKLAQEQNGRRDARHHIAHLQLIDPADVPRFAPLGIVANFQSYWAQKDKYISELTIPFLGTKRSSRMYPIGSVQKTGAVIAGGSDWPVTTINPLHAIEVAITRQEVGAAGGTPWLPEQTSDLAAMLAAYTIDGAYVNHLEQTTGSIEVGKDADMVILDKNLFAIPAREIHDTKVLRTFLRGKEVYRAESDIAAGSGISGYGPGAENDLSRGLPVLQQPVRLGSVR